MIDPAGEFKEQMIEARRTQILRGAVEVFAKKGFHKATTKEIAQAAGVAEGTIYNYFENKRELFLAMIQMFAAASLQQIMLDHPPEDPKEFLKTIFLDRYQLLRERGHIMAPLLAETFTDPSLREEIYSRVVMPLTKLVEQYLQHHIEAGRFRPGVDPVIATRAFIGALGINMALKLSGMEPRYADLPAETMIDQLISLFLDGLLIDHDLKK
jgi:AcrR family transcriptional regulator